MKWLRRIIKRLLVRLFLTLRKVTLPGFRGMGLYDVLKFFFDGLFDSKFTLMAAAMAYNFFFSLFPLLFLLISLLPRLPIEEFQLEEYIIAYVEQWIPEASKSVIENIVSSLKTISFELIILNVFLILYGATRGIIAMMKAFTKDAENREIFKRRNIFQLYGIAFILLIILTTLLIVSIGILITGESFIQYMRVEGYLGIQVYLVLLKGLNYFITLVLLFFSVSVIYYLAPATRQRWHFFSPGTIVSGFLMWLTIVGFRYFFSNIDSINEVYRGLVAVILLMLWFYYISIILLTGFELNTAIDLAQYHRGRPRIKQGDAL